MKTVIILPILGWDMKEGMQNPTHTNKVNTNIHQYDGSDGSNVNNNTNGYNADTDDNIVNIINKYKNNVPDNKKSNYDNHVSTSDSPKN